MTDELLEGENLVSREYLGHLGIAVDGGLTDNLHLLVEGWIVESDIEHETVELCLGKRIGAFLLDGVLRGEDKEGVRQRVGSARDCDAMFLHSLEQSRLGLGRGTVDFVGKDDAGEDRPLDELEIALTVEDFRTRDVGRHEVGSELDARERKAKGLCQRVDHKGLGQSRDTEKETVSSGENREEEAVDSFLLAHNDFGHLITQFVVFLFEEIEVFFVSHFSKGYGL